MNDKRQAYCPECEELDQESRYDRRKFVKLVGQSAVAISGASLFLPSASRLIAAEETATKTAAKKPGEELVRELFASLNETQKSEIVLPWDHGADQAAGAIPTRLGMYNRPIGGKKIKDHYTKPQQELVGRILREISAGEEGYNLISREGSFDGSGSLEECGAVIFGDPSSNGKFSWVFSGHHLTVRCDGNSEPGAAFGGPMYYGHSPDGYSAANVFYYQTQLVRGVFDALDGKQREKATVSGSPGEQAKSVQFRGANDPKPGIACHELSSDQKELVEKVMRGLLSPYRKEDADEVLEIVKKNGGMDKIHLAFYADKNMDDKEPWHFWRLEGPGFVWNYRVLPHVHCYVNIAEKA